MSQKIGEAPACSSVYVDVCVAQSGNLVVLDVCAPTMPCVMQIVAQVDDLVERFDAVKFDIFRRK